MVVLKSLKSISLVKAVFFKFLYEVYLKAGSNFVFETVDAPLFLFTDWLNAGCHGVVRVENNKSVKFM